jgi:DUF4097 and DUF4098 domain-containing protein YvlB
MPPAGMPFQHLRFVGIAVRVLREENLPRTDNSHGVAHNGSRISKLHWFYGCPRNSARKRPIPTQDLPPADDLFKIRRFEGPRVDTNRDTSNQLLRGEGDMIRSAVIGIGLVLLIARVVTTCRLTPQPSESDEQTQSFSAEGIKTYSVRTDIGTIEFQGQDDSAKPAEVVVTRKAWAEDRERAKQALAAIEVTIDRSNPENCKVGWHWRGEKQRDWSGSVDFTIRAPKQADLEAKSDNGQVSVEELAGNATIVTDNGNVDAKTTGESLDIRTKNGVVDSEFAGRKVHIHAENGAIKADLSHCGPIEGSIRTTNGLLAVTVGDQTSCELEAKTVHGHISCTADLQDVTSQSGGLGQLMRVFHGRKKGKFGLSQSLSGKLGDGGGKLALSTENGIIRIDD